MNRREAVKRLVTANREALIVTGLGSSTYDVHAAGDHESNYYLWGAMGGAALVGLGLALAQPSRRTMVITGDGEQLMALGSLATIAAAAPPNLEIIVVDNEHYGETGNQVSHTGRGLDLAAIASACGFVDTAVMHTLDDIDSLRDREHSESEAGPRLYVLKVDLEDLPRSLPPRDAVFIKNRFRAQFGLRPS